MPIVFSEDFDDLLDGDSITSSNTVLTTAGTVTPPSGPPCAEAPQVTNELGGNVACSAPVPDHGASFGLLYHWNGPEDFTSGSDLIEASCSFYTTVTDPDWFDDTVGTPGYVSVLGVGDFGTFSFECRVSVVRQEDDTFAYEMGFYSSGKASEGYAPWSTGGITLNGDTWYDLRIYWVPFGGQTDVWVELKAGDEVVYDFEQNATPVGQVVAWQCGRFGTTADPGHWNVYLDNLAWSYVGSVVPPQPVTESATRLYPRDDGLGVSARRTYPPPRAGRLVGGFR